LVSDEPAKSIYAVTHLRILGQAFLKLRAFEKQKGIFQRENRCAVLQAIFIDL
jgi:hypothetical protein